MLRRLGSISDMGPDRPPASGVGASPDVQMPRLYNDLPAHQIGDGRSRSSSGTYTRRRPASC